MSVTRLTKKATGMKSTLYKSLYFSQEQARIKAQRVLLHKAILRPIMLYASPIWAEIKSFCPRSVEMLQPVERRALCCHGDVTSFSLYLPTKEKQKLNQLGERSSTSVVALHSMCGFLCHFNRGSIYLLCSSVNFCVQLIMISG
ncbi:hypothetical protein TNCV_5086301 [Trichonephila clavipes]|uniref:Uncharacterized protein n=1 Tax=Trichonephila clavipes TaxID=2585209 RepID=A0A8X6VIP6_TRICX|nr:hypothetical protein TNCV_5086301 [Trichonephila clavipes]